METPQFLQVAQNKVTDLTQELALWQNVVTLLSGTYSSQFTALTTEQKEANQLASDKEVALTAQKTAEDALAVATTTIGTLQDQITTLTPPVEVAPQVTPPEQQLS